MGIAIAIGVVGLVIIIWGQWAKASNERAELEYRARRAAEAEREAEARREAEAERRRDPLSDYGIEYKDIAVLLGSGDDRRVLGDDARYLEWAEFRHDLDSPRTCGLDAWWESLGRKSMHLSLVYEQYSRTGPWRGPFFGVAVDEQEIDWWEGDHPKLMAEMGWAVGLLRGLAATRKRELSQEREADRQVTRARQQAALDGL
jgi:hypothetical protein